MNVDTSVSVLLAILVICVRTLASPAMKVRKCKEGRTLVTMLITLSSKRLQENQHISLLLDLFLTDFLLFFFNHPRSLLNSIRQSAGLQPRVTLTLHQVHVEQVAVSTSLVDLSVTVHLERLVTAVARTSAFMSQPLGMSLTLPTQHRGPDGGLLLT